MSVQVSGICCFGPSRFLGGSLKSGGLGDGSNDGRPFTAQARHAIDHPQGALEAATRRRGGRGERSRQNWQCTVCHVARSEAQSRHLASNMARRPCTAGSLRAASRLDRYDKEETELFQDGFPLYDLSSAAQFGRTAGCVPGGFRCTIEVLQRSKDGLMCRYSLRV